MSFFSNQLSSWEQARNNYAQLEGVKQKRLTCGEDVVRVQWNPSRIVSTGAKMDARALAQRPCFLCDKNRPKEQQKAPLSEKLSLLVNPFPIFRKHYTMVCNEHKPQRILENYSELRNALMKHPELMVFYNGPKSGASAPDHMHLQGAPNGEVVLQQEWGRVWKTARAIVEREDACGIYRLVDYLCPAILIKSKDDEMDAELFRKVYDALPLQEGDAEPQMNILAWMEGDVVLSVIIPRSKHRPECYYAEGEELCMVSPGAVDMAGLIITPRQEDYEKLTAERAIGILRECALSDEQMDVVEGNIQKLSQPRINVGIMNASKICFRLNGKYLLNGKDVDGDFTAEYTDGSISVGGATCGELLFTPLEDESSFTLFDVKIGINFHWERLQAQTFNGALRIIVAEGQLCAINVIGIERYLMSVISSEMKSTSNIDLLKAHAVISRSWLLAQLSTRGKESFLPSTADGDEIVRWYDREDHSLFDVCADDHCQRYQGITNQSNLNVIKAVSETSGEVLMCGEEICDARFSKCCGGITEEYQYCWENIRKPYLASVEDPYCNTNDAIILRQVLNSYDQETNNFYSWTCRYTQDELSALIRTKTGIDFGAIKELVPLSRGESGRIYRLKIVGEKRTLIIGKELEIRRALSPTHLYSSWFDVVLHDVVDGIPQSFELRGRGWGHGVGLCQIGAAVMGAKGIAYREILSHYYKETILKKIY